MPERTLSAPGTTAQHAVEELRRTIGGGLLGPGERVRQEEIAERLGISLAPVREALAVLEREGQVTYRPRRGYFVTELRMADLIEIYELRELLETRLARDTLAAIDADALERVVLAASDCAEADEKGDVAARLEANRRFHFAILEPTGQAQALRLIGTLWDSTEAYRAMYYNTAAARSESLAAHERIVEAIRGGDPEALVAELDVHRNQALGRLGAILDHPMELGPGANHREERA
jgi:DNA-binding GntR family transcriptional regulator